MPKQTGRGKDLRGDRPQGMLWDMKGVRSLPSSRRSHLGALALFTLFLLFGVGPLHVWHHAAELQLGDDGTCLPCSTFHKTFWISTAGAECAWTAPLAGFVCEAVDAQPVSIEAPVRASRAPPSSLV